MKSIVCIPGIWKNRSDLVTSIAVNNVNEYIFSGNILANIRSEQHFEMEICDRDVRMLSSFRAAGITSQLSETFLQEINEHNMVVYLIGEGGSLEKAAAIAKASRAILKAGGIGVKVETAGKAFAKEQWTHLLEGSPAPDLYKMFVVNSIANKEGEVFSCGMHNLGLKDTVVSDETVTESIDLIAVFSHYQITDQPKIHPNQMFSVNSEAPVFYILDEPAPPYRGRELFENPYGMWRLKRKVDKPGH